MCHPWPQGRVGSRVQNFALKSQIFLQNKSLRTLRTFFLRPIMGMRSAEKNGGNWDLVPPNRLQTIFADFGVIWFSAERHYTNCVPDFCWKKFSAELSIQTFAWAELIFWFCGVDCWFNVWTQDFCWKYFFRRNSTSQNVYLSSADLGYFFRRKSINLVMHDYPWLPAAFSCANVKFILYQPQWQINWSRILTLRTMGFWNRSTFIWPWKWTLLARVGILNVNSVCWVHEKCMQKRACIAIYVQDKSQR